MRSWVLRRAEAMPAPVRRSVLRMSFGAPAGPFERLLLALWHALAVVAQRVRRRGAVEPPLGMTVTVVDATGLSGAELARHAEVVADLLAGVGGGDDLGRLMWLVDVPDLVTVARRGWLVDHVGPAEHAVADRVELLSAALRVRAVVRAPADPGAWDHRLLQA
ncbi:hypothetical protein [Jannaschia sp. R86511]|uniref:hypothetical protein n=1 Tax=Jannaschia sp. R86511 TaxID=3093853 RepID=UPI0036D42A9C